MEGVTPSVLIKVGDQVVEGGSDVAVLLTTNVTLGSVGLVVFGFEFTHDTIQVRHMLVFEVGKVFHDVVDQEFGQEEGPEDDFGGETQHFGRELEDAGGDGNRVNGKTSK